MQGNFPVKYHDFQAIIKRQR